jgi:hypothetical protein
MTNNKKKNNKAYWLALAVFLVVVAVILFLPGKKKEEEIKVHKVFKGKIAIVLDDWGYNSNNLSSIKQIKAPLTLAILPNLNYSKSVSRELRKLGFEIILHLPMEPKENLRLEKDTIKVSMQESKIKSILMKDLENISFAKGLSNHMGSMATSDINTMRIIFSELKKRNLYFLDSFVIAQSVCQRLAYDTGVRFAKRDIFLDNSNDPREIKSQLLKLKARARLNGYAIGIGHDRKNTLMVLKEAIPEMEKEGYKFVFVSELAK